MSKACKAETINFRMFEIVFAKSADVYWYDTMNQINKKIKK